MRQPDAVICKEDLRLEFAHDTGDPDPRVRLVDARTGRVLVALPPEHAAEVGEALQFFATNAEAAAAQMAQMGRGQGGDLH